MNFKFILIYLFLLLSCDDSTDNSPIPNSLTILSIGSNNNNSIQIQLSTLEDIAGFQFTLTGTTISGVSGGLADQYDFSVSTGDSIVIGFSFSGDIIPSGSNGILTNVLVSEIFSSVCLEDVIFSSPNGVAIEINIDENCLEY